MGGKGIFERQRHVDWSWTVECIHKALPEMPSSDFSYHIVYVAILQDST